MRERRPWWHWNHNAHFHTYLLERLPSSFERGLEVGCGTGTFARALAARAAQLDAIDVEPAVVDAARLTTPQPPNIRWLTGDVLTGELPLQAYDVVTAIASLHHLPLEQGLRRLADLVRPNGHLAVVGLAPRVVLPRLPTRPCHPAHQPCHRGWEGAGPEGPAAHQRTAGAVARPDDKGGGGRSRGSAARSRRRPAPTPVLPLHAHLAEVGERKYS